jgi:hypothetical protein
MAGRAPAVIVDFYIVRWVVYGRRRQLARGVFDLPQSSIRK